MKLHNFDNVHCLSNVEVMDIIPKCSIDAGYFTDFTNYLRMETLLFYPVKYETARLTIEPYFINRDFGIVYGFCMNEEFMEFNGNCTQLCVVKFVGSSLDSFRQVMMQAQRNCMHHAIANSTDINQEMNAYMDTRCLKVVMEKEMTRRGDKYHNCVFTLEEAKHSSFIKEVRSSGILNTIQEPSSIRIAKYLAANSSTSTSTSTRALQAPKPPRLPNAEMHEMLDESFNLF